MNFSYQMYEMTLAALAPARAMSDASLLVFRNPFNPLANTSFGKNIAAGAELFERITRRYGKPVFGFKRATVDGVSVAVREEVVWERPFCRLLHFVREGADLARPQPPTADRRADVRPLCDAAARHRRGVPADP